MPHLKHPADWAQALALVPESHSVPMGAVDTAWLHMDSDVNRMVIVGVWILRPGIRRAALCARIQATLLQYPRFLQCAVDKPGGVRWVPDTDFALDHHIVSEKLPRVRAAGQQAALQDRVAELAVQPLDGQRPLWQFHLVEHYQGGSAMIVRIHHCIADGVALVAVMQSLVDGGSLPPRGPRRSHGHGLLDRAEALLDTWVFAPAGRVSSLAWGAASAGASTSWAFAHAPRRTLEHGLRNVWSSAKWALHGASDVAAMALMPDDSATRLKGRPSGVKRVAWCQPLALADVKAVSKAMDCSVNDVLLGCVAGAMGHYLQACGDEVQGQEIRAMVPVNLRPIDQAYALGNQFGLAPLLLPMGIRSPVARVHAVHRRMAELKGSMQPLMAFGLLALAGALSKPVQDALLALFSRKTTAVMTNVIGPKEKMRFLGATVEQSLFWVPQSGSVGLGVSILSYGGGVQFGVIADTALCPDPQAIIDQFVPEFERLARAMGKPVAG
ncbi:MAG: wax ester/triacylglycerol synthase family O-acyltransferase [Pseudomonadota bacterium]